jgi:hypothetical protein
MFHLKCRHRLRVLTLGSAFFGMAVVATPVAHATTITVVNNDSLGEGFNDPTPVAPVGGNTGTNLGDQRLIAFQHAADIWAGLIVSPVAIRIGAQFNPLTCNSTSAVLGSAGAAASFRNFSGALVPSTWYPIALANALHGSDLDPGPGSDDITAQFNSSIGTTCAFPKVWYYGLDANPPGSQIDFVSVVLHELAHGLGFQTLVNLATGAKALGFNDTFMLNLEDHGTSPSDYPSMTNAQRVAASMDTGNLHWVGANVEAASGVLTAGRVGTHVRMFAPNPQQPGSSVSHWDTALNPNEVMEPIYTGPLHDVGLALELFVDLGWNVGPTLPEVTIAATDDTATEQGTTTGMFTVARTGSTASPLTVNYTVSGTATPGSDYFALSGNVVILTGQSSAQIVVTPKDDAVVNEGNETVLVTLAVGSGYAAGLPSNATVTITDNDIVAPDTLINSGPTAASGGATNSTTAVFNFTSSDPSATFACSLDGAAFSACTSLKTYTKLKPGAHNFKVQATASGVTDPTPASFDWTIDKTAPNTTITSAPALLTNDPVATFTFTSTEVGGGFQCSLDGSLFADCTSPYVSIALADGKHKFRVKAVDAAGNTDKTAAKAKAWTVDTILPVTTITGKPADPTTSVNVAFKFKSEKKSTFQCSLDGQPSTLCKSGQKYSGLLPGLHNFQVQATDAAQNVEQTPATFAWTIN